MRGPVLWLQHTSSTPDTSTRRPYVPTMLQGPLACSGEYKTKTKTTMTVQNFFFWLWRSYQLKLCSNGRGQQCLEFLTSVLAVEWTRMQQLPTMLVPAVHRGKDTTLKTLHWRPCVIRERGPNNLTFRGPAPSVVANLFCFQYSDTALYTQLLYFSRLFDFDHAVKNAKTGQYFE